MWYLRGPAVKTITKITHSKRYGPVAGFARSIFARHPQIFAANLAKFPIFTHFLDAILNVQILRKKQPCRMLSRHPYQQHVFFCSCDELKHTLFRSLRQLCFVDDLYDNGGRTERWLLYEADVFFTVDLCRDRGIMGFS